MDNLVLVIFVLACTAPLILAAMLARRLAAFGWWLSAAAVLMLGISADPKAVAFALIDGSMTQSGCGNRVR
jgi:hypothetical protein